MIIFFHLHKTLLCILSYKIVNIYCILIIIFTVINFFLLFYVPINKTFAFNYIALIYTTIVIYPLIENRSGILL